MPEPTVPQPAARQSTEAEPGSGQHLQDIRDAARTFALDHYLAALLAPAAARDDLVALTAWWGETCRISQSVSEPALAEIRLQWWRDALQPDAGPSGHPVADAVREVIARHDLDHMQFERLLDARSLELDRVSFDDQTGLSAYVSDTDGVHMSLRARVLGLAINEPIATALELAAQSYGRVRIALALPHWAAHGRMTWWNDTSPEASAREAVAALAAAARAARGQLIDRSGPFSPQLIDAILPVALVEPYLRALQGARHDPLRDLADISPLGRVVRLAWARFRGRV